MKRSHVLEQTTSNARPWRVIFFDTETKQTQKDDNTTIHSLKLGVARVLTKRTRGGWKLDDYHLISDISTFWDWVSDRVLSKKATYIVAHNIVFDLSVMGAFPELAMRGWELKSFYSKGMVSIFRWAKGKDRLIGLDNGNFFSGKLEKWGKLLDLPKLDIDFDHATDEELLIYCKRDVDIMVKLWQEWIQFLDDNKCGSFKPTVASTAFNTWRHRFMTKKVHIHNEEKVTALERLSYKGGRTECKYVGELHNGPYYYLDVNNMYGYVMDRFEFPAGLWGYSDKTDLYRLAYKLARYAVIARVLIHADHPVFPILDKIHTCYPIGTFETVLTTPELKYCIDHGWLLDVFEVAWYRKAKIFSEYIRTFVDLRKDYQSQNRTGFATICKLLTNALYGKFGQRGFRQEIIGACAPDVIKTEEVYDENLDAFFWQTYIGGNIYREWREGESYHSFPAIAAHVTAYARMYLQSFINITPPNSVYYTDTDSLIVDQSGYNALRYFVNPDVLGLLKIERSSPWLIIHAPKDYIMEGRTRRKGIAHDAVQLDEAIFKQTQWLKLRGLIRNEVSQGYMTKTVKKNLQRVIHSGVVLPSGWIAPFVFPRLIDQEHTAEV